jgi:hypothetical protein
MDLLRDRFICKEETNYRIFRPIKRALSIQKRCKIVKNEHVRYMLERFPTDNARVICTKKGIGKYGIMY